MEEPINLFSAVTLFFMYQRELKKLTRIEHGCTFTLSIWFYSHVADHHLWRDLILQLTLSQVPKACFLPTSGFGKIALHSTMQCVLYISNEKQVPKHGCLFHFLGCFNLSIIDFTVGETLIGTSTLVPVTKEPALTCMYSTPQSC